MRFKIPISIKERKRYICIQTSLSKGELARSLEKMMRQLSGIKGMAYYRFLVISAGKDMYVIKTTESSIKAILTAILMMIYEDNMAINVVGISGTLRKARGLCEHDS